MTPSTLNHSKPDTTAASGRAEKLTKPDAPDQMREKLQQIKQATEAADADPEAESEDDLFPKAAGGAHPRPPRPEHPMRPLGGDERAQTLLLAQYPSEGHRRLPDVATTIPFSPLFYLDLPAGHYPQATVDHNAAPATALEQHTTPQQTYPSNALQQHQYPPSHDLTQHPNAVEQVQATDNIRPLLPTERRTPNIPRHPDLRIQHYGTSSVRSLTQESNLLFINYGSIDTLNVSNNSHILIINLGSINVVNFSGSNINTHLRIQKGFVQVNGPHVDITNLPSHPV